MAADAAFQLWLERVGITFAKNLITISSEDSLGHGNGIRVAAKNGVHKGDVLCVIPKSSILSVRTTGIADILEKENYDGGLGLTIALMYEVGLGRASAWYDSQLSFYMCPQILHRHDSRVISICFCVIFSSNLNEVTST